MKRCTTIRYRIYKFFMRIVNMLYANLTIDYWIKSHNKWIHVTVVKEDNMMTYYKDGVEILQTPIVF